MRAHILGTSLGGFAGLEDEEVEADPSTLTLGGADMVSLSFSSGGGSTVEATYNQGREQRSNRELGPIFFPASSLASHLSFSGG